MLVRKYEMPWRTAYEGYATAIWVAATGVFGYEAMRHVATRHVTSGLFAVCALMALFRLFQSLRVLKVRAALCGRAMQTISSKQLASLTKNLGEVFLGYGFEWQPVHSQRLYELAKVNFRDYIVSPWWLRILGYDVDPQPDDEIGLPYIHGVEPVERPLYRPLQNFEGGTLLVGTTQSGKGVALAGLITQAVRRGDVVVVMDPKNSERLKRVVQRACADYREPDAFIEFHPAFPEIGVRVDPMFNWQKPTEIASRVQSIMPPNTGAFGAFAWDAVNVVVQGLVDLEDRPNLMKLARYIEGGIEPVLEATLRRYLDEALDSGWRDLPEFKKLLQDAKRGEIRRPSDRATAELLAMVAFYQHSISTSMRSKVVDSQIRTFQHPREHYQKITANVVPILSMLTSGALGKSLSPDPFDADDRRPIMNMEKIVSGGHVLYMCLDSLPDPDVASAIGAIWLADMSAFAGMRYNLGGNQRISLFVDEVSNVINTPLIELLNKGAEGGIFTTCAMQTLADMAKRLGSEEAARMALGNLNNLIAFRSKDRPTQEFIVETFGKTAIHTMKVGLNHGIDAHVGDFSSGYSTQISEPFEESVPADVLGKLPNLQYFASVSGGRLLKGRFPIIDSSWPDETKVAA